MLATLFWGFSFPLMKVVLMVQRQLMPECSEWFLVSQSMAVRFSGATLAMLLICLGSLRRLTAAECKLGIGLGVFGGLGMLLQTAGLNHTLASTSAFLTQFYVLLIPITLALWHRRLPSPLVWVSCALVIAGMGVLCGVNWPDFKLGRGEWLTVLASVIFMGEILWLDRREFAVANKRLSTLVMLATIAVICLPLALLTAAHPRDLLTINASWPVAGFNVFLAVVCAAFAFYLMNTWQPRIHPTHAGLVYCAEPVFASVCALFLPEWVGRWSGVNYPNEQLTANLWIGGALVTIANVLIQFVPKEKEG